MSALFSTSDFMLQVDAAVFVVVCDIWAECFPRVDYCWLECLAIGSPSLRDVFCWSPTRLAVESCWVSVIQSNRQENGERTQKKNETGYEQVNVSLLQLVIANRDFFFFFLINFNLIFMVWSPLMVVCIGFHILSLFLPSSLHLYGRCLCFVDAESLDYLLFFCTPSPLLHGVGSAWSPPTQ